MHYCCDLATRAEPLTPGPAGSTTPGHADGPAGQARFYNLRGVAVDGDGNVFVADSSNHCLRQLTAADSMVSTLVGECASGWRLAR